MITMVKRIVSVMVSCVFISMVCIPAAHADDVSGSIDLNVQALNDDAPVVDDGSLGAEYPKDENGNPINPWEQVKCSYDSWLLIAYCVPYGISTVNDYIDHYEGYNPVWLYDANTWYCIGVYSNTKPVAGALWQNEYYGKAESNEHGIACFHAVKKGMSASERFETHDTVFSEFKTPDGYLPVSQTFQCDMTDFGEIRGGCVRPDDWMTGHIGWGSWQAGLISVIRYKSNLLSSFPITGEYTLYIVISMVLIAGITIIFIHRYGRKHNG